MDWEDLCELLPEFRYPSFPGRCQHTLVSLHNLTVSGPTTCDYLTCTWPISTIPNQIWDRKLVASRKSGKFGKDNSYLHRYFTVLPPASDEILGASTCSFSLAETAYILSMFAFVMSSWSSFFPAFLCILLPFANRWLLDLIVQALLQVLRGHHQNHRWIPFFSRFSLMSWSSSGEVDLQTCRISSLAYLSPSIIQLVGCLGVIGSQLVLVCRLQVAHLRLSWRLRGSWLRFWKQFGTHVVKMCEVYVVRYVVKGVLFSLISTYLFYDVVVEQGTSRCWILSVHRRASNCAWPSQSNHAETLYYYTNASTFI